MLKLHYIPGTAAMAPHAALAEAGAEYTLALVEQDEAGQRPPAYLALNPWGQVPTLEDGDFVLTESVAIMLHLADRFPEANLGAPVGTRARSELYKWLLYLSYGFQATYMHWYAPERYTTAPEGAAAVRACALATLRRHIEWIDAELATRPWLVGDERTAADIYLHMLTHWGRKLEPPAWDSPNVGAHYARVLQLPGVQRMMTEQELT
jgi:glutathione S-transferase